MSDLHQTSCLTTTSKSQLNHSSAKACFSFPRQERLPPNSNLNDMMYQTTSMLSKRSTSFGFGKKSSIVGPNFSPSPDKYEKRSDFEKSPKKGQTFGIGRNEFKAINMFNTSKVPGPGEYENNPKPVKESSKNYSMRIKPSLPSIFHSNHNPGPGHYKISQDTEKEFFFNSKAKAPKIYTIMKANKENVKLSPIGPNSYETSLDSMGKQVLAKRRTEQSFYFPKKIRDTMPIEKSMVGPGSYQHFSEFGK